MVTLWQYREKMQGKIKGSVRVYVCVCVRVYVRERYIYEEIDRQKDRVIPIILDNDNIYNVLAKSLLIIWGMEQ